MEDPIKHAFSKVKEDITSVKTDFIDIKKELSEIQISLLLLNKTLYEIKNSITQTDNQTDRHFDTYSDTKSNQNIANSTQNILNPTIRQLNKTENTSSTDTSTHILPFQVLKQPFLTSSIGNRGVSTDRQTIRQTDNQTDFKGQISSETPLNSHELAKASQKTLIPTTNTSEILDQLDAIKKDLRLKIKRLTPQEMLVFSAIYQLEDQGQLVDYTLLSNTLSLSESSIRDYIQRVINKGFTLDKEKINNKKVLLHIPQDTRKLASLDTILKLRDI